MKVSFYRRVGKRVFDLAVGVPLLCLLLPLFAVLSVVTYSVFGTPVFFCQQRPGLGGKPFMMYKFRTMRNSRDEKGVLLPDEQRLTRYGSLLRSLSLDELPELLNVVRGQMSLVGPRPLLMEYLPLYSREQFRRHEVKPGLTGWAQVNGRNVISWEEKFMLDVWYVDNCCFRVDLRILFTTISKVITREGVCQPGKGTVEYFTGSVTNSETR